MNTLSNPSEFSKLIQKYFLERLLRQKNASPQTVAAYRDAFKLFFAYAEQQLHKPPAKFTSNDFNANAVLQFLDYLERERGNSIRSRNARLAALHSFAKYVTLHCPPALHLAQQILAVPMKKFDQPLLGFLSRVEMDALLATPNTSSWCGQRDRILLALMYNTGARVSELIGVCVTDVTLDAVAPSIRLRGKGRKQRTLPLWKETASDVRAWIKHQALQPHQPLLPGRQGAPMTRSNIADRLSLVVSVAAKQCPTLINGTSFLTTAVYCRRLLQDGVLRGCRSKMCRH
jgi:site-specific recombinase XerD